MKYKNMKIEINESQPIDDVVRELERLGYNNITARKVFNKDNIIVAFEDGEFIFAMRWAKDIKLTSLTELKEIK